MLRKFNFDDCEGSENVISLQNKDNGDNICEVLCNEKNFTLLYEVSSFNNFCS